MGWRIHMATGWVFASAIAVGAASVHGEAKHDLHWSLRPLAKPAVSAVNNASWVRNPIDAYVLAALERAGMQPSPPADRATLLRRAHLDLVGLPPTPEELAAFLRDDAPDAYEKVIDRLLASPRYGERWGRHWLDLARYADSGGFHNDIDRPQAWRYRDYVIRSFNEDKPYARFIREQLAGDEIEPTNDDALIATGFMRNGPSNEDQVKPAAREQYRLDELDDVIATTGEVFLGLTIGCSRCHDHPYDPLTQTDYYRWLAIFNACEKKELPLPSVAKTGGAAGGGAVAKADKAGGADAKKKKGKGKPKGPVALVFTDRGRGPRVTHLLERGDPKTPAARVEPGVFAVFHGGSVGVTFEQPEGDVVGYRTKLADWIASPDNPLTYRVAVNRLWKHHFGRGLVGSPSNFGVKGQRPTHPQLLDWLARELIEKGGSLKAMHRLIMTSNTYRQASTPRSDAMQRDPGNRLLWRMNKRRLEAEAIRDSVLHVSGKLNLAMGGPGIKPRIDPQVLRRSKRNKWPLVKKEGPEHWRRSVYIYIKRQLLMPMMELLDAPTSSISCGRREVSVTPTQALILLNGTFTNEQADYFASRVEGEARGDVKKAAARALTRALARPPSAERLSQAVAFLDQQAAAYKSDGAPPAQAKHMALTDLCHVLINCNEFVYIE